MSEEKSTKEKKVAIIGKAANSQMLAPFEDKDWEVWGLSNAYIDIPENSWDVWFELHDWEYHRRENPTHWQWLMTDHGKPIYTFEDNYLGAPCAKKFPIHDVLRMFGNLYNNNEVFKYWTNSPSYMMALAILEGATHIGLWGVDMAMSDEYAFQRPSCELMIGYCLGRGIAVTVPEESALCKARRLYGYETHMGDGYVEVRTRENHLKKNLAESVEASQQADQHRKMFFGALQEIQEIERCNKTGEEYNIVTRKTMLETHIQNANQAFENHEKRKIALQGAMENLSWVKTVFLT